MSASAERLDACLDQFAKRLPETAGRFVRWSTGPTTSLFRVPAGLALVAGGIVGFLPILGFWMVPLGLVLIAKDVPFLRSPLIRLLTWVNRKWPHKHPSRPA